MLVFPAVPPEKAVEALKIGLESDYGKKRKHGRYDYIITLIYSTY